MADVWTTEPDGTRKCIRHGSQFARTSYCHECASDPPPTDDELDVDDSTPPGCLEPDAIEARFVELADYAEAAARALLDDEEADFHKVGMGVKLMDSAIKALRAAAAAATNRVSERVVRVRMRELKAMMAKASH